MLWQKYIVSSTRANFGKDVCLLKCLFVMRLTENLIFFSEKRVTSAFSTSLIFIKKNL